VSSNSTISIVLKFTAIDLFVAAAVVLFAGQAQATESAAGTPFHKLGRGVSGVVTSWVEVPKHVYQNCVDAEHAGGKVVAPFTGSALGLWLALQRITLGIYELVTFPIPIPAGYRSIYEQWGIGDSAYEER
jgi:putative exosortase-associated protein (TIGR04073 family)